MCDMCIIISNITKHVKAKSSGAEFNIVIIKPLSTVATLCLEWMRKSENFCIATC